MPRCDSQASARSHQPQGSLTNKRIFTQKNTLAGKFTCKGVDIYYLLIRNGIGRRGFLVEHQFLAVGSDHGCFAFMEVAFEDFLSQWVFQEFFDRAAHGTRSEIGIVPFLDEK